MSNMAANNKEIGRPNGFEGLLKYYVKLTPTRFLEQWVTPKHYNELLLEIFSSWVTPLNGDKNRLNFQCVYCGGKWSIKLWFSNHRSKGCPNDPIDPITNKPICIPMFHNLATAQLLKVLKRQIKNNDASSIQLKLQTQVDVCRDLNLGLATKARACKGAGRKWSLGVTFYAHGSVGGCARMNPHTPKWVPTLEIGVPMDSRIFWERLQRSKLIGLKSSL
jgi:hypothetical protein